MKQRNRLVYGVGINDADYHVVFQEHGKRWVCPIYQAWSDMIRRCHNKKRQERHPTYRGCTVTQKWFSFLEFRAWMSHQDFEGKQLDKDILCPGNKIYSPETCAFVSQNINTFVTDSGATRGDLPLGVHLHKRSGKLVAQCRNPFTGKKEHLGYFLDSESAHEAWRNYKHKMALIYADLQTDPRVAQALRTRYAPSLGESCTHSEHSEYQISSHPRLPHGPDECAKAQLDILSQE